MRSRALQILPGLVFGCWSWTVAAVAVDAARPDSPSAVTEARFPSPSPVPHGSNVTQPPTAAAEEEAEGGTEVVELPGGDSLGLRVSGGIEPGVFAIKDEDLAGRLVITPAHAAGLFQQECAGFTAVETHAVVVLGVAGPEGGEVIVVIFNSLNDGVGIGLCKKGACGETKEQNGSQKRIALDFFRKG